MVAKPVLLALAVLLLALPGVFVFDDLSLLQEPAVVGPAAWQHWFTLTQTRPLTYISFWADYSLYGNSPAGFHFTNALIHLLAGFLLWRALRLVVEPVTAGWAAALFLVHPLALEPLHYTFARSSSLSTVFCLAAFWCWLRERPSAAVGCFALALLAKEECVAFPLFLALFTFQQKQTRRWLAIGAMLGLSVAAGLRVLFATSVITGAGSGFGQTQTPWEYFQLQGQAVTGYLFRALLPLPFSIDPPVPEPNLWAWLLIAALVWRFWKTGPWFSGAVLLLLPSSSVLPAADAVAYRRMYLPMTMLTVFLVLQLRRVRYGPWVALGGLAVASLLQRETWQSERGIWQEALAQAPGKVRPRIQLARLSPPAEALAYLRDAKKITPDSPDVASEMGKVLLANGDAAGALAQFGQALALAPNEPRHLQNRGVALAALNQPGAAIADFRRALRLDPCLGPARDNLRKLGENPPPCLSINSAAK